MLVSELYFFKSIHYENHKEHVNTLCSKITSFLR